MTKGDRRVQKHDDGRSGSHTLRVQPTSISSGNYIPNHQYDRSGQFLSLPDFRISQERPPEHVVERNPRTGKRAQSLYVENLNTQLLLISCSQGILSYSSFSCYPLLRLFVYMYLSQLMRTFTIYLKCIVISS